MVVPRSLLSEKEETLTNVPVACLSPDLLLLTCCSCCCGSLDGGFFDARGSSLDSVLDIHINYQAS